MQDEDLGNDRYITFHTDAIPKGEHKRRYNESLSAEVCIMLDDSYARRSQIPPAIIRKKETVMNKNGNIADICDIIHNCNELYDPLHCVISP